MLPKQENEMRNRKMAFVMPLIIFTLLISACGASMNSIRPTATSEQTRTSEPVVQADCWHTFVLSAWQDVNGDALWGASELPLEGVRFMLVAGPMAEVWGYPPVSNAEGRLEMTIWHPGGCFTETYTISVQSPGSFQPTTPTSVTFSPDETKHSIQFGFRPISKE